MFSSVQRTQANPLAPMPRTNSVSLSTSLRVSTLTAFLAVKARTVPPPSRAEANTPKPQPLTASDKSTISMPYRMSGLSEPYRSMASL